MKSQILMGVLIGIMLFLGISIGLYITNNIVISIGIGFILAAGTRLVYSLSSRSKSNP
ncbi:hypothetical protein [Halobacillus massiliensis]|uniref:hypothetical protein n=1 Tax=Halobacillus massiliensis TaxID=1926286 RepID=UPI0015C45FB7|nr:hypothetical protein [Halobacillus massiliensis]